MSFFQRSDDRNIVEALNASQAVIEFTPDGRILTANANFLKTVGYSLAELRGQHHSLFCDKAYASGNDYRRFWSDLAAGRFASGTYKRFGKDGRTLWLQATYNPIRGRNGAVTKVVKFASDVTDAKAREIDLNGKIEALDRAQAVIEFTTDARVITANDNFLKAMDYRLDEIAGKPHAMFCEPDFARSAEYQRFWDELRAGRFQTAEYKRLARGGREVYIQASYNPIRDDTGAVVKIVKFATDVTGNVARRLRNESLSHAINHDLGDVVSSISDASRMSVHAGEASGQTDAVIASVAAATEELTANVRDIAQNMHFAREGVEGVFRHAETANASAASLNRSATSMTNVVTLIQSIAGQINLLALNATIESARAGEAGRGFAVVASEVKNLANQAASSTQTIAAEIASMQSVTTEVVDALALISSSMNAVLGNVSSVAGAIEQQHAVTGQISENMQTAVGSVHQISDSLSQINTTFARVAEASEKVKLDVENLVA